MAFRTFDNMAGVGGSRRRFMDTRMQDAAGAFLESQLERMDQTLHMPISSVTWGRDIDVREDVTIADEFSSFANATFASAGGINPTGKAWISKTATAITGILADAAKTVNPLNLWGMEIGYTVPELLSSQQLNKPIDATKHDGMRLKYQMDIDEQVYVGDAGLGLYGLTNSPNVVATNVPNGASGSSQWTTKTPNEILADINALLTATWVQTGTAIVANKLLLPPLKFAYINQALVSTAGNRSVLNYLSENSLAMQVNGKALEIQPVKWLTGRGVGGTDRMVAYTQDPTRVRLPLTPLQNSPVQYRGIHVLSYYYGRIGVVEMTNVELVSYADGI